MAQGLEVKRQRIRWDVQTFCELTRRKAFRAGLNEKPIDLQTTILSECAERLDGISRFHGSRIVEFSFGVKHSTSNYVGNAHLVKLIVRNGSTGRSARSPPS